MEYDWKGNDLNFNKGPVAQVFKSLADLRLRVHNERSVGHDLLIYTRPAISKKRTLDSLEAFTFICSPSPKTTMCIAAICSSWL